MTDWEVNSILMKIIARIHTDFPAKFGIPRQSCLVDELQGIIEFETEFRQPETVRGLEGFNYIWLLWEFSENRRANWSATVKPPRLNGEKMGVFATRSPYRPNPIGLSSVHLDKIEIDDQKGPLLYVSGIDLMDNTPIYDIKPYLPHSDCHLDAKGGFSTEVKDIILHVNFPENFLRQIPIEKQAAICGILEQDPRPSYDKYPDQIYGIEFAGYDIKFKVQDKELTVCGLVTLK